MADGSTNKMPGAWPDEVTQESDDMVKEESQITTSQSSIGDTALQVSTETTHTEPGLLEKQEHGDSKDDDGDGQYDSGSEDHSETEEDEVKKEDDEVNEDVLNDFLNGLQVQIVSYRVYSRPYSSWRLHLLMEN